MKNNKKKDNSTTKDKAVNPRKERDDKSYFAVSHKRRKKNLMIVIPAVIVLLAIMAYAVNIYSEHLVKPSRAFGPLGSEHVHAAFAVTINGKKLDFCKPTYQVRSPYIRVEHNDGNTMHRHATGVAVEEFFRSLRMNVSKSCFTLENITSYC